MFRENIAVVFNMSFLISAIKLKKPLIFGLPEITFLQRM